MLATGGDGDQRNGTRLAGPRTECLGLRLGGYAVASARALGLVIRAEMAGLTWGLRLAGVTLGGCGLVLALGPGGIGMIAVAMLTHPTLGARLTDSITPQRRRVHDTPGLVRDDPRRVTTPGWCVQGRPAPPHWPTFMTRPNVRRSPNVGVAFCTFSKPREPGGVRQWLNTTTAAGDALDPRSFLLTPTAPARSTILTTHHH